MKRDSSCNSHHQQLSNNSRLKSIAAYANTVEFTSQCMKKVIKETVQTTIRSRCVPAKLLTSRSSFADWSATAEGTVFDSAWLIKNSLYRSSRVP